MDDHRNAQEDNKAFKLDLLSEAKEAYILEVNFFYISGVLCVAVRFSILC